MTDPRYTALDGDTFSDNVTKRTFRIAGADTPETAHSGGIIEDAPLTAPAAGAIPAQEAFQQALNESTVSRGTDSSFGRTIATVTHPKYGNVANELIASGLANVLNKYGADGAADAKIEHMRRIAMGTLEQEHPEWAEFMRQARDEREKEARETLVNFMATDRVFQNNNHYRKGVVDASLARGVDNFQASWYGFVNTVGDVVGSKTLKEVGADGMFLNMVEAAKNPPRVESYEDIDSLKKFGTYFVEAVVENSPQLAFDLVTALATGGTAALAGVGKGALRALSPMAVGKAGAVASIYTQSTGETRIEQAQHGVANEDGAALSALATGGVKTALEYASLAHILGGVMKGKAVGEVAEGATTTVGNLKKFFDSPLGRPLTAFGVESVTEGAQTYLDYLNIASFDDSHELDVTEVIDSMLKGGLAGGGTSAIGVAGKAGYDKSIEISQLARERRAQMAESAKQKAPEKETPKQSTAIPGSLDKNGETVTAAEPVDQLVAQVKHKGQAFVAASQSQEDVDEVVAKVEEQTGKTPEVTQLDNGGTHISTDAPAVDAATTQTEMGDVLGYAQGKDGADTVVQTVVDGQVVNEQAVSAEVAPEVIAQEQEAHPEAEVVETSAQEALAERERKVQVEKQQRAQDITNGRSAHSKVTDLLKQHAETMKAQLTETLGEAGTQASDQTVEPLFTPEELSSFEESAPASDKESIYDDQGNIKALPQLAAMLKAGTLDTGQVDDAFTALGVNTPEARAKIENEVGTLNSFGRTVNAIVAKVRNHPELLSRFTKRIGTPYVRGEQLRNALLKLTPKQAFAFGKKIGVEPEPVVQITNRAKAKSALHRKVVQAVNMGRIPRDDLSPVAAAFPAMETVRPTTMVSKDAYNTLAKRNLDVGRLISSIDQMDDDALLAAMDHFGVPYKDTVAPVQQNNEKFMRALGFIANNLRKSHEQSASVQQAKSVGLARERVVNALFEKIKTAITTNSIGEQGDAGVAGVVNAFFHLTAKQSRKAIRLARKYIDSLPTDRLYDLAVRSGLSLEELRVTDEGIDYIQGPQYRATQETETLAFVARVLGRLNARNHGFFGAADQSEAMIKTELLELYAQRNAGWLHDASLDGMVRKGKGKFEAEPSASVIAYIQRREAPHSAFDSILNDLIEKINTAYLNGGVKAVMDHLAAHGLVDGAVIHPDVEAELKARVQGNLYKEGVYTAKERGGHSDAPHTQNEEQASRSVFKRFFYRIIGNPTSRFFERHLDTEETDKLVAEILSDSPDAAFAAGILRAKQTGAIAQFNKYAAAAQLHTEIANGKNLLPVVIDDDGAPRVMLLDALQLSQYGRAEEQPTTHGEALFNLYHNLDRAATEFGAQFDQLSQDLVIWLEPVVDNGIVTYKSYTVADAVTQMRDHNSRVNRVGDASKQLIGLRAERDARDNTIIDALDKLVTAAREAGVPASYISERIEAVSDFAFGVYDREGGQSFLTELTFNGVTYQEFEAQTVISDIIKDLMTISPTSELSDAYYQRLWYVGQISKFKRIVDGANRNELTYDDAAFAVQLDGPQEVDRLGRAEVSIMQDAEDAYSNPDEYDARMDAPSTGMSLGGMPIEIAQDDSTTSGYKAVDISHDQDADPFDLAETLPEDAQVRFIQSEITRHTSRPIFADMAKALGQLKGEKRQSNPAHTKDLVSGQKFINAVLRKVGVKTNVTLFIGQTDYDNASKFFGDAPNKKAFLAELFSGPAYMNTPDGAVIYMPDFPKAGGVAALEWYAMLGHELGHMYYDHIVKSINAADVASLKAAFKASHADNFGEWFADQFSAAVIQDMAREMDNGRGRVATSVFDRLVSNMRNFYNHIKTVLKQVADGRFELNETFKDFYTKAVTQKQMAVHNPDNGVFTVWHYTPTEPNSPINPIVRAQAAIKTGKVMTYPFRMVYTRVKNYNAGLADKLFKQSQSSTSLNNFESVRVWLHRSFFGDMQRAYDQIYQGKDSIQRQKVEAAFIRLRQGVDDRETQILRKMIEGINRKAISNGWESGKAPQAAGVMPEAFNHAAVAENRQAFAQLIAPALNNDPVLVEQAINNIIDGSGIAELSISPGQPVSTHLVSSAIVQLVGAEQLYQQGFLVDNPMAIMQHYIKGLAARTSWERTFGEHVETAPTATHRMPQRVFRPNHKFITALEQIERDHGPKARAETLDMVRGALGLKNQEFTGPWRTAQDYALGITNMLILAFSGVASIPELGLSFVRGNFDFTDIAGSIKNLKWAKAFAMDTGIIMASGAEQIMRESIGEGYNSTLLTKANELFFKVNGQELITKLSRVISTSSAVQYVMRAAELNDIVELEKLGLDRATVQQWDADGRPAWQSDSDPEHVKKVSQAISQFVDEASLNPSRFQAAHFGNNPYMKLVWHLKQFMYTYGDTILGGLYRSMKQRYADARLVGTGIVGAGAYAAWPLLLFGTIMLPLALASLELREFLSGRSRLDDDSMKNGARLWSAAGGFGPLEIAYTAYQSMESDHRSIPGALIPTYGKFESLVSLGNDGELSKQEALTKVRGLLPFGQTRAWNLMFD